jgi:hypothetical protein
MAAYHHQNFYVENAMNNNNLAGAPPSASPGLIDGPDRIMSSQNCGITKPLNPRKIIVKRSRHIRDLSQDYS